MARMRLVTYRESGAAERVGRLEGDAIVPQVAGSMIEWLAGEGREDAGDPASLAATDLLAPVPDPPSVRDFFAYEDHVATGAKLRGGEIPEAWYEVPVFYFSNPASIHGPGEPVLKPPLTSLLDFELEIAAVIGAGGTIAGFTLMNDWSARDLQRQEMSVGLGPAKGKDFATSLGPWLATPDELPYRDGRLELTATARVNGEEITRTDARDKHWSWPELVTHSARDTRLRPGDVIGSGTLNRGCLLELGPLPGDRFLEPGDEVTIAAEGLGELTSKIV
jgi:fumarylacetoacetate (FAA) hydrolase